MYSKFFFVIFKLSLQNTPTKLNLTTIICKRLAEVVYHQITKCAQIVYVFNASKSFTASCPNARQPNTTHSLNQVLCNSIYMHLRYSDNARPSPIYLVYDICFDLFVGIFWCLVFVLSHYMVRSHALWFSAMHFYYCHRIYESGEWVRYILCLCFWLLGEHSKVEFQMNNTSSSIYQRTKITLRRTLRFVITVVSSVYARNIESKIPQSQTQFHVINLYTLCGYMQFRCIYISVEYYYSLLFACDVCVWFLSGYIVK